MNTTPAKRLATGTTAMIVAFGAAGGIARADQSDTSNPFRNHQQFVDCEAGHTASAANYSPWYHLYHSHGTSRKLVAKIARVPTVKWFTAQPTDPVRPMARQAERYITNVDHPAYGGADCTRKLHYSGAQWQSGPVAPANRDAYSGDFPVMALRALNDKTCAANADPTGRYKSRVDNLAFELARTYASPTPYQFWNSAPPPFARWRSSGRYGAMILEPDALGLMGARSKHCVRGHQKKQVLSLLRYAVKKFAAIPGLAVYIDGGAGDWLHVDEDVSLLRQAGVAGARGFALNASHFDRTRDEISFGNKVAKKLHKHYVVNTAENAHGPLPKSRWHGLPARIATNCNPENAGLGEQPTAHTGSKYADAFLWISRPGLSSNAGDRCGRGPTTNTWYAEQAISLARKASFSKAHWPARKF